MLHAIAQVESGGRTRARGKGGERGLYQFRKLTWYWLTREDFEEAYNPTSSTIVARDFLDRICGALRDCGLACSAYNVELVWRCGLKGLLTGHASDKARDSAQRVQNLYLDLIKRSTNPPKSNG